MKETYFCGVCGKSYETIEERNKCEAKCLADRAAAERKRKEEELRKTKEARKKEVDMAWDHYNELRNEYLKDYGSYSIVRDYSGYPLADHIERLFRW